MVCQYIKLGTKYIKTLLDALDHGTCLYTADSTDPLTYTVVTSIYFVHILPEDSHQSGPKHVVS
jgi:hypothetical protein